MKILASDFDGTLSFGRVSEYDKEAICRWRGAGNRFGIVTGREFRGIWYEIQKNGLEVDFIGAYNGGIIFDSTGENILYETSTSPVMVSDLIDYIKSMGAEYADLHVGKTRYHLFPAGENRPVILTCENFGSLEKVTMINTHVPTYALAVECAEVIKTRFGEWFNPLLNGCYIDIPAAGVDKGVGVRRYMDYISRECGVIFGEGDIITVGDQLNDFEMVSQSDFFGCAVENAVTELKAAAKAVYKSVGDLINSKI